MSRPSLRTVLGVALIVLGVPPLLAGTAAAVYIGPDDTVEFARSDVAAEGSVVSTAVSIATVTGPVLHVSARADGDGDGEVFVGVAHRIHVDSYLDGVAQQTVTAVDLRGEITSEPAQGSGAPDAPPSDLDWWQESASGPGWRSVSYELTDEPVRVVVASPDPSGDLNVSLSFGAEVDGVFATGVLVGVAGLLLVAGGVLILSLRRRRRKRELSLVPPPIEKPADSGPADGAAEGEPDAVVDEKVVDEKKESADDADDAEEKDGEKEKIATVTPLPRRPLPKRTPPPPAPEPPPKPTARVAVVA